jgi:hypothetical protein
MTLQLSRDRRLTLLTAACALSATTLLAQSHHSPRARFNEMDANHDGVITRSEWRGSDDDFRAYDLNGDGTLSWHELSPGASASRHTDQQQAPARQQPATHSSQAGHPTSRAFEAGHQRGLQEGRSAGQQDNNRGRWDLDGQQELERADSGYREDLGAREEYQAGYREGFMTAYREAFGARAPRHGEAYRQGQTRGLADGREAGREDASRSHWDLEGQQEMLMADAGYRSELGARSEYQEGYRAGFRQGYSEGFGRH